MPDPGFDASKPHISRVYDYLLGGKDNFAADRAQRELVPEWRPDPGTQGVQHHPVLGLAAAGVASKA